MAAEKTKKPLEYYADVVINHDRKLYQPGELFPINEIPDKDDRGGNPRAQFIKDGYVRVVDPSKKKILKVKNNFTFENILQLKAGKKIDPLDFTKVALERLEKNPNIEIVIIDESE